MLRTMLNGDIRLDDMIEGGAGYRGADRGIFESGLRAAVTKKRWREFRQLGRSGKREKKGNWCYDERRRPRCSLCLQSI